MIWSFSQAFFNKEEAGSSEPASFDFDNASSLQCVKSVTDRLERFAQT